MPKSETSHEDMIAIMEHFQQYVPLETETSTVDVEGIGEKEIHADRFHHVLFGGDQLTAKRARGSQYVRSNSLRGKERLEGLKPVVEDWHTKVLVCEGNVWYMYMYVCREAGAITGLCAYENLICCII